MAEQQTSNSEAAGERNHNMIAVDIESKVSNHPELENDQDRVKYTCCEISALRIEKHILCHPNLCNILN